MAFYVEDGDLGIVSGEKCRYCREQPADERFYFYPAHYFCSMECKTAWYTSPDEDPTKPATEPPAQGAT